MYKKYIKRIMDIIFSFILIIITLPIMVITFFAVYFDLGRPIFYEFTKREGKNKKPFQMYKFRTKTLNTRGLPDHIRYTKISKIIDITRINELPQLFNVLKGDMSLVGPRPFIVNEKLPPGDISEKRYLLKPGITGLSQVSGAVYLTHKEQLKLDEIYYDNLSFINDFKILIKTPIAIIKYLICYYKNK